ncbi:RidA family protein [Paraburkholderia aspalathi]|nr:RidA family protein [Paraburkholderia aspalathi]
MTQSITRLNPPSMPNSAEIGYSQISIVEPGRMAYVSGQVAWNPNGEPVPTDLVEQTRLAAMNAKAALDALGATTEDIAILRCFMTNLNPETLGQAFPVILEFFDGAQPCITGVGVAALASPELKIELELTVRLPDQQNSVENSAI